MFLLPRLELQDGRTVHALREPGQGEATSLEDPVEVATRFARMGAQGLHVVDVDRSLGRGHDNDDELIRILDHTWLPVEAAGGVESLRRIQELIDTGCARVIVGTMGVLHQDWLKEAALCFPDRLIAGLDARDGRLVVKGRTEPIERALDEFATQIDGYGLEALHIAHLSRSNGNGFENVMDLVRRLRTPVTVEGAITTIQELRRLEAAGVHGVSLGREIYDGSLNFAEVAKSYRVL